MSVKNLTVKTGATFGAMVGGADLVFTDDGLTIVNGLHLVVPTTADYRVRQSATLKYKAPSVTPSGMYGKDKKTVSYTVPFILATGEVVFNVIRVEREVHPELSAAAALDMLVVGGQLAFDSDMTNFWAAGSLS